MFFALALMIGSVIGGNVGLLMRRRIAMAWNILTGSAGAVIGGLLFGSVFMQGRLAEIPAEPLSLCVAALGALILLVACNLAHRLANR